MNVNRSFEKGWNATDLILPSFWTCHIKLTSTDTPHTKPPHPMNQSQIAAHWPYPHLSSPILSPSVLLRILRLPGSIWEVSGTLPRKRHWPLGALRGSASFKPSTKVLTRDGCNYLRSWINRMAWYWNDVLQLYYIFRYIQCRICVQFCHLLCFGKHRYFHFPAASFECVWNAWNRSRGWAAEYLEKSWNHGMCRSSF